MLLQHFQLSWQLFAYPRSVSLFVRALLNLKTDNNSRRFLTQQATVKSPWQLAMPSPNQDEDLNNNKSSQSETVPNLKEDLRISKRRNTSWICCQIKCRICCRIGSWICCGLDDKVTKGSSQNLKT